MRRVFFRVGLDSTGPSSCLRKAVKSFRISKDWGKFGFRRTTSEPLSTISSLYWSARSLSSPLINWCRGGQFFKQRLVESRFPELLIVTNGWLQTTKG